MAVALRLVAGFAFHARAAGVVGCAARGRALATMGGGAPTPSGASSFRPSIIVYTKRDCPLCDGLALNLEEVQQHVDFAISKRYIEERAEWEELYRYEVPVLVGLTPAGVELPIPRPSPRAAGAFLMKWLRKHYFEKLAGEAGAEGAPASS